MSEAESSLSASTGTDNASVAARGAEEEATGDRCRAIVATCPSQGLQCERSGTMVVEGFCGYHRGQRPSFLANSSESLQESEHSVALSVPDALDPSHQTDRPYSSSTFSLRSRATVLASQRVAIEPITDEQEGALAAEQAWSLESREAFAFVQALFQAGADAGMGWQDKPQTYEWKKQLRDSSLEALAAVFHKNMDLYTAARQATGNSHPNLNQIRRQITAEMIEQCHRHFTLRSVMDTGGGRRDEATSLRVSPHLFGRFAVMVIFTCSGDNLAKVLTRAKSIAAGDATFDETFSANEEAFARILLDFAWTDLHAKTTATQAGKDPMFHLHCRAHMRQVRRERKADKSRTEVNDAIVKALQFVNLETVSVAETLPEEDPTDDEDDDEDMFA